MKILKLSTRNQRALAIANTKVRNVILVPHCPEGVEGVYVDYDAMIDPRGPYAEQRAAISGFTREDVFEYDRQVIINVTGTEL